MSHREHGGALSGEGVRVHHPGDAAPVGGNLPGHVNPGISLGDILNYSGLIGNLVTAFVSLKGAAVGAAVPLHPIEAWLPGLGEWDLQITATRKR
jgi:hypothetical protein